MRGEKVFEARYERLGALVCPANAMDLYVSTRAQG
jgi:hypothetical protein